MTRRLKAELQSPRTPTKQKREYLHRVSSRCTGFRFRCQPKADTPNRRFESMAAIDFWECRLRRRPWLQSTSWRPTKKV